MNRRTANRIVMWVALCGAPCFLSAQPARGAGPEDEAKLERKMRDAYADADYMAALEAAEKLHKLRPDNSDDMYNIACLHCLLGQKDKAYEWLEKAVEAGYDDAAQLRQDPDFTVIRGEDRFRRVVRRILREDRSADDNDDDEGDDADDDDDEESERTERPATGDDERRRLGERINELTGKLIEHAEKKDYEKALNVATEAHDLAEKSGIPPLRGLTTYNMACMNSLLKNQDEALDYLEAAAEFEGFARGMEAQMVSDSDLDNVRDDPRYEKVLKTLKKKYGKKDESLKFEVRLPKNYQESKAAPILIALHPYGGDIDEAIARWKHAADGVGAILIAIRGPAEVDEGKYQWGNDFDSLETEIIDALDEVIERHKVDEDRVVIAGFSQGALVAYAMAVRAPEVFCGLVPVGGTFRLESESDFDDEDLGDLRLFIMYGDEDVRNVLRTNRQAARRFKRAGATVETKVFEGLGHEFPPDSDEETLRALRFVLDE
jgi:phospholipase/carboxylesterase